MRYVCDAKMRNREYLILSRKSRNLSPTVIEYFYMTPNYQLGPSITLADDLDIHFADF